MPIKTDLLCQQWVRLWMESNLHLPLVSVGFGVLPNEQEVDWLVAAVIDIKNIEIRFTTTLEVFLPLHCIEWMHATVGSCISTVCSLCTAPSFYLRSQYGFLSKSHLHLNHQVPPHHMYHLRCRNQPTVPTISKVWWQCSFLYCTVYLFCLFITVLGVSSCCSAQISCSLLCLSLW